MLGCSTRMHEQQYTLRSCKELKQTGHAHFRGAVLNEADFTCHVYMLSAIIH